MMINLNEEITLDDHIKLENEYLFSTPQKVLLTGATGFLGAYMLYDLLNYTTSHIYCLLRADSESLALQRLFDNWNAYMLDHEEKEKRITPVLGDLSKSNLGIEKVLYEQLSKEIDSIYHLAASVSFAPDYQKLKAINVVGIQEIIKLAALNKPKLLHFVSTYAVFNTKFYNGSEIIFEKDLEGSSEGIKKGYGQSKWVAENICYLARRRGIPITIYRPGIISADQRKGIYNPSCIMNLMILSVITMGYAQAIDFKLHFTPVDYCSRAIALLAQKQSSVNKNFHLVNTPISWQQLLHWLAKKGHSIKQIEPNEWYQRLYELIKKNSMFYPLYFLVAMKNDQNSWSKANVVTSSFDDGNVKMRLKEFELSCPALDDALLDTYYAYWLKKKVIEPSLIKRI